MKCFTFFITSFQRLKRIPFMKIRPSEKHHIIRGTKKDDKDFLVIFSVGADGFEPPTLCL